MKLVLAIVVIAALGAVAGAIIVGTATRDQLVVADPYETGLKFDNDRHHRESAGLALDVSGIKARSGANSAEVVVRDRGGKPVKFNTDNLKVTLVRPTENFQPVSAALRTDGTRIMADFTLPADGLWDMTADVTYNGVSVTLKARLYAAADGAAH